MHESSCKGRDTTLYPILLVAYELSKGFQDEFDYQDLFLLFSPLSYITYFIRTYSVILEN